MDCMIKLVNAEFGIGPGLTGASDAVAFTLIP